MPDWDPDLYDLFDEERRRPFDDLVRLLPPSVPGRWVDLGCGHGQGTSDVAERLGASHVLAVDRSSAMLERAPDKGKRIAWREADIVDVVHEEGRPWDLVLSNAALHWVDGHEHLFPRLLERVAPGGWLAVQMPFNHRAPTHTLLDRVAREPEFAASFDGFERRYPVLEPEAYATLLEEADFRHRICELRTYRHAMPAPEAIADFTRATAMRPYLERLDDELHRDAYIARYVDLLDEAYPPCDLQGTRLLDYQRLLIVGRRPPG
ncbi:MAG: methyltransferase domain-containing protein [Myxococcota bacterium]